ncbi:DNA-binding response regulator [Streptomyces venezuelae]|uniref:DNA-binding response regulator n=1 Tax=Streptomyces venezuelae TaxID=54571 RepID=A0A5P2C810_STRVZ|nr:response regulator transcription factor [Streptomyces venezuelae]QES38048.1 DNA-binding response regulator [Streptomyces venezuelae]
MTIRVLLADDQALLTGTFRVLIDAADGLEVVATAGDGEEAVRLARSTAPDVVVMDIRMPHKDGLSAAEQISADPRLDGTRVLILTTFETGDHITRALRAGVSGFLGKGVGPAEFLAAIRTVAAGDMVLSPLATHTVVTRYLAAAGPDRPEASPREMDHLTPREQEVLLCAAEGLTNDEIAERLFVSPLTVRTFVQRIMHKLGVHHRAQLVALAYRTGFARVPQPPPARPRTGPAP